MRVFALLVLLGCEQARPPENMPPAPQPVPGPRPIQPAPPPPSPTPVTTPDAYDEVRAILHGKGTFDPQRLAQPNRQIDPAWDFTRVKLVKFQQQGRAIAIEGSARGTEDVTQFVKRLAAVPMFADVIPVSGERQSDGTWNFKVELAEPHADPGTVITGGTTTLTAP